MNRFDPARGVRFRTFASRRIHGSVLDGLEIASEKHQQIAARKRLLAERALSMVECREEANGTSASPARTQEQLLQYVAEAGIAFALGWLLEGTGLVDTGDRHANLPFYRSVELRELRERIVELVATLPPQESAVVRGHYLQAQPFDSIAARLGVSGGRVSQLHKRALARLRGMLHPTDACDVAI
jgi:RNA polymerase sigma factor for flagellar operon FliA